ncbi:MAG: hypothetical protein H0X13_10345 [Ramlibacter sp.]|nr:hypothetical protein [Ramlibacter sp.]
MSSIVPPRDKFDSATEGLHAARAPVDADTGLPQRFEKILFTSAVPDQQTAWTKARMDVQRITEELGYAILQMPASVHPGDWLKLGRALKKSFAPGGHLLIEYPFEQRKRIYLLHLLSRFIGAKLYGLIHDLDSLRFEDSPRGRELAVLKLFDGLIAHNPTMSQWLRANGFTGKLVDLNLFDYYSAPASPSHENGMTSPVKVLCASNLSFEKAGYIYDRRLGELRNVALSLYGAFFEPQRMPASSVAYKGVFDPNTPRLDGKYHFGLVWDGTGVERCDGSYGRYMQFNNPHKLSLYVSLGLPVVVWKQAAAAEFVLSHGIGVTVGDLRELGELPARVSSEAYQAMAERVACLSHKVKRGMFLNEALRRLSGGSADAVEEESRQLP